jgi:protein-L-isoaspartate(D-aspartate) O-methyltransferase
MHTDAATLNIEQARFNMIEQQVRPWDVLDGQVLKLLNTIKREAFAPAAHQALAFMDTELPLGALPDQVMLAPRVQARFLQDLLVKPTDRVLDVGTGSGFMAALLGAAAREVVSLEIDSSLAAKAQEKLLDAGLGNVRVRIADASRDLKDQGLAEDVAQPFDVICISGALSEVPEHLRKLLAVGGRMMAVVGQEPVMRATRWTRVTADAWRSEVMWDTVVPALRGFATPAAFKF